MKLCRRHAAKSHTKCGGNIDLTSLTSLDFFLWRYLKSKVYLDKPTTTRALKEGIQRCLKEHIYRKLSWKIWIKVCVCASEVVEAYVLFTMESCRMYLMMQKKKKNFVFYWNYVAYRNPGHPVQYRFNSHQSFCIRIMLSSSNQIMQNKIVLFATFYIKSVHPFIKVYLFD